MDVPSRRVARLPPVRSLLAVSSRARPNLSPTASFGSVVAAEQLFLGKNLLAWLLLALGAALALGNGLALVRPPNKPSEDRKGELDRAPVGRSLLMAVVGLVAAVWALATLTR